MIQIHKDITNNREDAFTETHSQRYYLTGHYLTFNHCNMEWVPKVERKSIFTRDKLSVYYLEKIAARNMYVFLYWFTDLNVLSHDDDIGNDTGLCPASTTIILIKNIY